MDLAKSKAVEGEPDNLICRRHERLLKEGGWPAKEMWAEPERCLAARRRAENRAARCKCHQDQAVCRRATPATLATYHESEAAKLQRDDAVTEGRWVGSRCSDVPE